MENKIDNLIKKHFQAFDEPSLRKASIGHYVEYGSINGSFRDALHNIANEATEELRTMLEKSFMSEIHRLKEEIERLTQSNKELVEALKIAHRYMVVFMIRGEEPLVGENLKTDSYTVLNLIEKSKP